MDTSVFDEVKDEISKAIEENIGVIKKDVFEISADEFNDSVECTLIVVSDIFMSMISDNTKRLLINYGDDKKLSMGSIVKIINPLEPSYSFSPYRKDGFKSIVCAEAVLENLESNYLIHIKKLNKTLRETKSNKSLSDIAKSDLTARINAEIAGATKNKEFIDNNFEKLDVRISRYKNANRGFSINYKTPSARYNCRLVNSLDNILWFREKEDSSRKARSDNAQDEFFQRATLAFGDVYFADLIGEKKSRLNNEDCAKKRKKDES